MSRNEEQVSSSRQPRSIKGNLRLGELLKLRRKELKLSLENIERDTHIRRKYLRLIESGDYSKLANDVYSRGYIKNYAEYLGFDTKEILRLYSQERYDFSQQSGVDRTPPRTLRPIGSATYTFSPKAILVILASLFVLIMVGYVGWQLSRLSTPPVISLVNQEKSIVNTSFVIISGEVDSGADVFINDSPILTTPDGSFSERVTLVDGSNEIKISAKNKFGKEATKVIIVESRTNTAQKPVGELKKATFDGVELLLSIADRAVFISVEADGQNIFSGTMLPGTKQLFSAKEQIRITTSNAGNTRVSFTNSVVAQRDIGELGQTDEARQDVIFSKTTEVK